MTGKEILEIRNFRQLFPNNEDIHKTYRQLITKWHPDNNDDPLATEVFIKINQLYKLATSSTSSEIIFPSIGPDKGIAIIPTITFGFEFGDVYVTNTKVIYRFNKEKKRFYQNALERIKTLSFDDIKMKEKMGLYLPDDTGVKHFISKEGPILVFDKPENYYPLKEVFSYYKNKLDDRHVAWIITRLQSICCYLDHIGLSHNGITLDNIYISPRDHTLKLLGGWWFSTPLGEKMLGTTKEVFDVMPLSNQTSKISSISTDLESVKALGRKLVGETNVRILREGKVIPKAFADFLVNGSSSNPYDEYEKWEETIIKSYGERKFTVMNY